MSQMGEKMAGGDTDRTMECRNRDKYWDRFGEIRKKNPHMAAMHKVVSGNFHLRKMIHCFPRWVLISLKNENSTITWKAWIANEKILKSPFAPGQLHNTQRCHIEGDALNRTDLKDVRTCCDSTSSWGQRPAEGCFLDIGNGAPTALTSREKPQMS